MGRFRLDRVSINSKGLSESGFGQVPLTSEVFLLSPKGGGAVPGLREKGRPFVSDEI